MQTILQDIEDFLIAFLNVALSQVGKQAVGDSGFVPGLRARRKARAGTSAGAAMVGRLRAAPTARRADASASPRAGIAGRRAWCDCRAGRDGRAVVIPPPHYVLWLAGTITPTLNVALRQHWPKRSKGTVAVAWAIRLGMGRAPLPAQPWPRALLVIERRVGGIPDDDGLVGGCKGLIDCLMPMTDKRPFGLGFIVDDGPAHLELEVRAVRAPKAARGMHLTLSWLAPI